MDSPYATAKMRAALASGAITKARFDEQVAARKAAHKGPQQQSRTPKPNLKTKPAQRQNRPSAGTHKNPPKAMVTMGTQLRVPRDPVSSYLATLSNPRECMSRIPDAYDRPTAVFRSVSSFNIPLTVDQYTNGRFSFCLQPVLGDLSDPTHYQCAVANASYLSAQSIPWGQANWSSASSYVGAAGSGRDPRIDTNGALLTAPPPTFYGCTFNGNDLSSAVLVSNVTAAQTPFTDNTTIQSFSSSGAPNNAFPPNTSGTAWGAILLPYGDWLVTLSVKFQVSVVPAGTFMAINIATWTGYDATVTSIQQPQTNTPSTGVTYTATATIQVVSSPHHNVLAFALNNAQNGATPTNAYYANATVSSSTLTVSPANFATSSAYLSGGLIEQIRPVAQAVLVTYMGSTLNNGGEIAIGWVPSDLVYDNYFQSNTSGQGQLQDIENLRQLDRVYDGPLRDGAYCIWAPFTVDDTKLQIPALFNGQRYPAIICSGYFTPDQSVSNLNTVLRAEVFTVFEFVTKYTCFEQLTLPGSTNSMEMALSALKNRTFGCANRSHLAWIRDALKSGVNWYKSNASWINPAVGYAASFL